jgi:hypothetical protein
VPAPACSAALPAPARPEPDPYGKPAHDPYARALNSEGTCAEAPLTSEPPLPDAEPLTSEPPLADASPLTSESDADADHYGPGL